MKKMLALLIALVLIAGLAACGPKPPAVESTPPTQTNPPEQTQAPVNPSAPPESTQPATPEPTATPDGNGAEVRLYSTMDQATLDALVSGFRGAHPDIDLIITGGTADDLISRLTDEAAQPQADVMWGGLSSGDGELYSHLFEHWVSAHTEENVAGCTSPNGIYSPTHLSPAVFVINEELEYQMGLNIESYEDLMDPSLWGMIAIADPNSSASAWTSLSNIFAVYGSDSPEAWGYIEVLMPNLYVLDSSAEVYQATQSGEYLVGLTTEDEVIDLIRSGDSIRLQYPASGTSARSYGAALVKNAPNAEYGKLLIDYICSAEGQTVLAAAREGSLRYANANYQAPSGSPLKPSGQIRWIPCDADYLQANRASILDRWNSLWSKVGG